MFRGHPIVIFPLLVLNLRNLVPCRELSEYSRSQHHTHLLQIRRPVRMARRERGLRGGGERMSWTNRKPITRTVLTFGDSRRNLPSCGHTCAWTLTPVRTHHRHNCHVHNEPFTTYRRVSRGVLSDDNQANVVPTLRFKKSGEFDRLRREMLSDFQRSVSGCALSLFRE